MRWVYAMSAMFATSPEQAKLHPPNKPRVVIAGGGVIGVSTAYFLARDYGVGATVVDRKELAAAASGRAGGFLARDWNDGSGTDELTHRSFDLHSMLGEELKKYCDDEGSTDYRRLTCESVALTGSSNRKPGNAKLANVEWADAGTVSGSRSMGDESTIAQVHPKKLVHAMMRGASSLAGATFVVATARGLRVEGGKVTGLEVDEGKVIEADAVVVAMGPWTHALCNDHIDCKKWANVQGFPPIVGTKYHAVLLQSPRVLSQAVFFQGMDDPEVYPRPDGEVYVTGYPERAVIVHDLPGETEVKDAICQKLIHSMKILSTDLKNAPVNHKQACHLPSAPDGIPIIGKLDGLHGAFCATGHGCWGILLGPATGEALADLLVTGEPKHIHLDAFDPNRFASFMSRTIW